MAHIQKFTFNPFQENTWVLSTGGQAIVVDPGCSDTAEEHVLEGYLAENGLTPVRLVLTHAHIDHVLGCAWMHKRYGLLPEMHRADLPLLEAAPRQGQLYGVPCAPSPLPERFITPGEVMELGATRFEVLFVPGHAPGHIALFDKAGGHVISGDVLFQRSVGRTDLPGGDVETLVKSIREVLFPLGDEVVVHSGHGPDTTIGEERRNNPYVGDRVRR